MIFNNNSTYFQVHHNVIAKYFPKLYHFEMDHMEVGNMLACLENNNNCMRPQKVTLKKSANGRLRLKSQFRIAYRKPKKSFIARKFYEPKKYGYIIDMKDKVRRYEADNIRSTEPSKTKRMAPKERNRNNLIRKSLKYSRFEK